VLSGACASNAGHLSCGLSSSIDSLGMESNVDVTTERGGSPDGMNGGNLALSVPSGNGVAAINRLVDDFKQCTGIEWYCTNIDKNFEDPDDETLVDWWVRN